MTQPNLQGELAKFGNFQGRLVDASCPICIPAPLPKLIFKRREGIGIWLCPGCKILYASPRFDEPSLLQIYENESFFYDKSIYANWTYDSWKQRGGRNWTVPQLKTKIVKRFLCEGDRVLDVGCATGEFCLIAMKNGLISEGIDISKMLTDIACRVLKVPAQRIDIQDFNPGHKFKGIVIWDVLEHLHQPVRGLQACNRLLEPGGYLFAQVPNSRGFSNSFKSLASRLGLRKNNYGHFGIPYHLFSFNKTSLTELMKAAGLKVVHSESWSHFYKNGIAGFFTDPIIRIAKRYCLSDYIVVVARKI